MGEGGVQYSIVAADDSTIAVEVLRTSFFRKQKCFFYFEEFTGGLKYFEDEPAQSRFSLEIDAASVVCRDRRLRSNEQRRLTSSAKRLCACGEKSSISFCSRGVVAKPLRGYVITGSLKLGDAVRDFRMNAMFGAAGGESIEMEGDAVIRFSELGIRVPSSLFGLVRVDDEAVVQFRVQAASTAKKSPARI